MLKFAIHASEYLLGKAKACKDDPDALEKVDSMADCMDKFYEIVSDHLKFKERDLISEFESAQDIAAKYKKLDPKKLSIVKQMVDLCRLTWSFTQLRSMKASTKKDADRYVARCTELLPLL